MYVDEKLNKLDKRSRSVAEKRINDILFELEMGGEINTQPPAHTQQFQQFSSSTNGGNTTYLQNSVAMGRRDSGHFMSLLKPDEQYY